MNRAQVTEETHADSLRWWMEHPAKPLPAWPSPESRIEQARRRRELEDA